MNPELLSQMVSMEHSARIARVDRQAVRGTGSDDAPRRRRARTLWLAIRPHRTPRPQPVVTTRATFGAAS
jgi:hypothetical protein